MTNDTKRWCVLIPCSTTETWAVPQNCLGEIMTLNTDTALPPDEVSWRGRTVPVLDFGSDDGSLLARAAPRCWARWRSFLGSKAKGASTGEWPCVVKGLRVVSLSPEEVEDVPERTQSACHGRLHF